MSSVTVDLQLDCCCWRYADVSLRRFFVFLPDDDDDDSDMLLRLNLTESMS